MRHWLGGAAAAARLVSNRAELWIPGALASLGFLGWVPLALAIVPLPDASDLEFFGEGLYSSGAWPWNVLLLSSATLFGVLTMVLVVALGESALQRGLRPLLDELPESGERHAPEETLTGEAAVTFVVLLVAMLPAAAAVLALAVGVAAVAPGEYQSPDIGGPVLLRIARDVAPLIALVVLATIVGQAFGSGAQRRAVGPHPEPLARSFAHAARDLWRRPVPLLGTALVCMATLVALTVLATLLLRVLWAPIGEALRVGDLGNPPTALLLVGFVAIWLCLVLAAGALHAWASAWWSLEHPRRLARPEPPTRPVATDPGAHVTS
jgi:hypothetical protein